MKTVYCPSCDELLPQVTLSCLACGDTLISLKRDAGRLFFNFLYNFSIKSAPEENWLAAIKQRFGSKRVQDKKTRAEKAIPVQPAPENEPPYDDRKPTDDVPTTPEPLDEEPKNLLDHDTVPLDEVLKETSTDLALLETTAAETPPAEQKAI